MVAVCFCHPVRLNTYYVVYIYLIRCVEYSLSKPHRSQSDYLIEQQNHCHTPIVIHTYNIHWTRSPRTCVRLPNTSRVLSSSLYIICDRSAGDIIVWRKGYREYAQSGAAARRACGCTRAVILSNRHHITHQLSILCSLHVCLIYTLLNVRRASARPAYGPKAKGRCTRVLPWGHLCSRGFSPFIVAQIRYSRFIIIALCSLFAGAG